MERAQFINTMFEIADLYVLSLEASEYASFLSRLLESIIGADGTITGMDLGNFSSSSNSWLTAGCERSSQVGDAPMEHNQEHNGDHNEAGSQATGHATGRASKGKKGHLGKKSKKGRGGQQRNATPGATESINLNDPQAGDSCYGGAFDHRASAQLRNNGTTSGSGAEKGQLHGADGIESPGDKVWRAGGKTAGWSGAGVDLSSSDDARARGTSGAWRAGGAGDGWSRMDADPSASASSDAPTRSKHGEPVWRGGSTGTGWSAMDGTLSGASDVPSSRGAQGEPVWKSGSDGWSRRDEYVSHGPDGTPGDSAGGSFRGHSRAMSTSQSGWSTTSVDHTPSNDSRQRCEKNAWKPGGAGNAAWAMMPCGSNSEPYAGANGNAARDAQSTPSMTKAAACTSTPLTKHSVESKYSSASSPSSRIDDVRTSAQEPSPSFSDGLNHRRGPTANRSITHRLASMDVEKLEEKHVPSSRKKVVYPRSLLVYRGSIPNRYRTAQASYRLMRSASTPNLPRLASEYISPSKGSSGADPRAHNRGSRSSTRPRSIPTMALCPLPSQQ